LGIVASDIATCPPEALAGITGVHFHNNSDSTDFCQLAQTVDAVGRLPLDRLSWLNIGGGYFPHKAVGLNALVDAVRRLRARHELEIFFEPGAAFVREAGFLVTSVLDVLRSHSTSIAILDSSVNHYPNFLAYGSTAHIASPKPGQGFRHVLAGVTCLAGDLFGELELDAPLNVGDVIVLESVGAYGLVKMHMFNGVPLPDVYLRTVDGSLQLLNSATYGDYLRIYVGA
jgi:carboxynorspermidine decarboxylase